MPRRCSRCDPAGGPALGGPGHARPARRTGAEPPGARLLSSAPIATSRSTARTHFGRPGRAAAHRQLPARAAAWPHVDDVHDDVEHRQPASPAASWRRQSTARPKATRCSCRRSCATWSRRACLVRRGRPCCGGLGATLLRCRSPRACATSSASGFAPQRRVNRVLTIAAVIGPRLPLRRASLRSRACRRKSSSAALEEAIGVGRARGAVTQGRRRALPLRPRLLPPDAVRGDVRAAPPPPASTGGAGAGAHYGGRLDEHAAELAEHFAQSTDPATCEGGGVWRAGSPAGDAASSPTARPCGCWSRPSPSRRCSIPTIAAGSATSVCSWPGRSNARATRRRHAISPSELLTSPDTTVWQR